MNIYEPSQAENLAMWDSFLMPKIEIKSWRWKLCAQESHWNVQNVNSVTTIGQRIRKLIQIEWKQKNIVDSVKSIQCTKKLSSQLIF